MTNTNKSPSICLGLLLICALASIEPGLAADDDDDSDEAASARPPIKLKVVSPQPPKLKRNKQFRRSRMTEYRSGWPLTFKLIVNLRQDQGVAVGRAGPSFPIAGSTSWLVLEGADDCFVEVGGQIFNRTFPCREANDEAAGEPEPRVLDNIVEFTPDEDFPGVEDEHGNADQQNLLQSPENDPPFFGHGPDVDGGEELLFGAVDGIGYGANDDLPGFVLLSNVGVGLSLTHPVVVQPHPKGSGFPYVLPPSPLPPASTCEPLCAALEIPSAPQSWVPMETPQARNLAGLMTSTGYELDDQKGRTTITTSMVVPLHMFAPTILIDQNRDDSVATLGDACPGRTTMRVDGGPVECSTGDFSQLATTFELRAFLVKGTAPKVWNDCNGDGVPSAADAECNFNTNGVETSFTVLSNEIVLTLNQLDPLPIFGGGDVCFQQDDPWGTNSGANFSLVDFEGNDEEVTVNCPGGSGRIRRF